MESWAAEQTIINQPGEEYKKRQLILFTHEHTHTVIRSADDSTRALYSLAVGSEWRPYLSSSPCGTRKRRERWWRCTKRITCWKGEEGESRERSNWVLLLFCEKNIDIIMIKENIFLTSTSIILCGWTFYH